MLTNECTAIDCASKVTELTFGSADFTAVDPRNPILQNSELPLIVKISHG